MYQIGDYKYKKRKRGKIDKPCKAKGSNRKANSYRGTAHLTRESREDSELKEETKKRYSIGNFLKISTYMSEYYCTV